MKKMLLIITSPVSGGSAVASSLIKQADTIVLTQNGVFNRPDIFAGTKEGATLSVVAEDSSARYQEPAIDSIARKEVVALIEQHEKIATL